MLTHKRSTVIDNVTYVHPKFIKMQPTGSKKTLHVNKWDWWISYCYKFYSLWVFICYLWKHVSLYIDNRILFLVIEIVNSAKRFGSIIGNFKLYSTCTMKWLQCHCVFQEFQFHFIVWIISMKIYFPFKVC